MYLIVTRSFPPEVGGMQSLMWGLTRELSKNYMIKVFADYIDGHKDFDENASFSIERVGGIKLLRKYRKAQLIDEFIKDRKKILFEGAQGILLDVDHGTYPYVTSSNTVPAMAATGSGLGPNKINYVLGITKAYTTRVGSGPFPTELKDKIGESLGKRGKEFGTVTARKRRCGWFDGVLVRQTIKVAGINAIALTKLDVLDELDKIKMCVEYKLNGKKTSYNWCWNGRI